MQTWALLMYRDRTVKVHHHSVSLVAKHVGEDQEVELFALLFFGDVKPI